MGADRGKFSCPWDAIASFCQVKLLSIIFVNLVYAAEVGNVDLPPVHSDVVKLDISVDSICFVDIIDPVKHLQSNVSKDIFLIKILFQLFTDVFEHWLLQVTHYQESAATKSRMILVLGDRFNLLGEVSKEKTLSQHIVLSDGIKLNSVIGVCRCFGVNTDCALATIANVLLEDEVSIADLTRYLCVLIRLSSLTFLLLHFYLYYN